MNIYRTEDDWVNAYNASDKLSDAAKSEQDCLSVLCTLSGKGAWETDECGHPVYCAPCSGEDRTSLVDKGVEPVDYYRVGDTTIPTRVAQHFGLGEACVCVNAGYILQGDTLIDLPVHQIRQDEAGNLTVVPTTLHKMLEEELKDDEDVDWKHLEWRHIQNIVDSNGGQSERFILLAGILQRLANARMDEITFVPYGNQFADSDFL